MSNKAITTNDLKAVLDVVLPPQPSEYRKLLWTNPSPSSGFAAQTISLDLSEYDEVEIECLASAGGTDFVTERCLIGKATMAQFVSGGNGYGSGTPFLTERRFATSTSGITASTGYGCFTGGSDWSYNSTTRMIPIYIYGIKYERVLPPAMDALAWKLQGTASGNTAVDMPTEYNEILLWTQYSSVHFSTIVPRAEVPANGYIYPRAAFYYTSASNAGAYFSVSSSKANLAMFVTDGGTNYTSSATFKLYYR